MQQIKKGSSGFLFYLSHLSRPEISLHIGDLFCETKERAVNNLLAIESDVTTGIHQLLCTFF